MKKLIFFLLVLVVSANSFSQPSTTFASPAKTDYLKKSKHQKTTGLILLSGGVAVVTISIIISSAKSDIFFLFLGDLVGGGMIIASVPFFNASARNKRKAMSLSFKNEKAPQILKSSFVYKSVPSLTLKINL